MTKQQQAAPNWMSTHTSAKCFACDKPLNEAGADRYVADTRDEQIVYVGRDCMKKIIAAGENGYQPPKGGPRLYRMKD